MVFIISIVWLVIILLIEKYIYNNDRFWVNLK